MITFGKILNKFGSKTLQKKPLIGSKNFCKTYAQVMTTGATRDKYNSNNHKTHGYSGFSYSLAFASMISVVGSYEMFKKYSLTPEC